MSHRRDEARRLRQQGMSVREIATQLKASKGSVSLWVRDVELTEDQKAMLKANQARWAGRNQGAQTNRRQALEKRRAFQHAGRLKAREMRPLHMMGCMLYWAEGSKHRNNLHFINSDANMMLLFMRFLREEIHVQESEFVMYIHCHTQDAAEVQRISNYWLTLLNLPPSCLRQVFYKQGAITRNNILENGVCTIRVYRSEVLQHIYGAIQEYGGFDKPEWLF